MPFRVPSLQETLTHLGRALHPDPPDEHLRILVWNVYKGKRAPAWIEDLRELGNHKDLILLQEAVLDHAMPVVWQESFGHFQWSMATSFLPRYAHPTGVATGSSIQPLAVDFIRGSEREFFVLTPKISLLSHFRLPDGQTLLVINTHFVNFTTTKAFVRFLTELLDTVSHHRGPMIMAGDFNTWSRRRWATLLETLVREDIFPVEFAKDRRLLKLDHVFYRGMTLAKAEIHHHIRSSDHFPLEVHFDIAPSFERTGAE